MNAFSTAAAGVFGLLALGDWLSVASHRKVAEYVFKPLALGLLIVVALSIDPHSEAQRAWFTAALVASLVGDVLLMLPRDVFIAGLGAFLLAHIAYVVGFTYEVDNVVLVVATLAVVGLAAGPLAVRIVRSAASREPKLGMAVTAYVTVIAVMVAFAAASGSLLATCGALLFMVSDSLIGWTRFVSPHGWAPVAIMATYHVAQLLLVLSLI